MVKKGVKIMENMMTDEQFNEYYRQLWLKIMKERESK